MPHTIKLAPAGYTGLRPRNASERRSLVKICVLVLFAVAAAVGLWIVQQHWRSVREVTWRSADGVIEDVRPVLAARVDSARGGAMLYRVEVLTRYAEGGVEQRRWIAVSQRPEGVVAARCDVFRWRGRKCRVRWNPRDAGQAVVEIGDSLGG